MITSTWDLPRASNSSSLLISHFSIVTLTGCLYSLPLSNTLEFFTLDLGEFHNWLPADAWGPAEVICAPHTGGRATDQTIRWDLSPRLSDSADVSGAPSSSPSPEDDTRHYEYTYHPFTQWASLKVEWYTQIIVIDTCTHRNQVLYKQNCEWFPYAVIITLTKIITQQNIWRKVSTLPTLFILVQLMNTSNFNLHFSLVSLP